VRAATLLAKVEVTEMTDARGVDFGDPLAFHGPNDIGSGEAWVLGHAAYGHEHDIAVL
jgi:hypothetical protein